ncbi:hypothetical protein SDRG_10825 [Saprolegnia diclina VS20]|uniref:Uncharacterized protein n=1 Tax=Saprolegnia diclina (strain VS20) TaxID=1156394 RepID=T0QDK2_SAPDV|nr:hypothetical protein SDRG_10825 [Saprolegnia diclina VS20]EQC31660.1 hypothetical protein SDRG_10825 [Saprolegnia diclina VS20]|eukprot:XP_008615059.1 hypothetical protein SDRG_10825 [Saprolegnia diclina VS20]
MSNANTAATVATEAAMAARTTNSSSAMLRRIVAFDMDGDAALLAGQDTDATMDPNAITSHCASPRRVTSPVLEDDNKTPAGRDSDKQLVAQHNSTSFRVRNAKARSPRAESEKAPKRARVNPTAATGA